MKMITILTFTVLSASVTSCGDINQIGRRPAFTPITTSSDYAAMNRSGGDALTLDRANVTEASLWQSGPKSLLGDRRAGNLGDLLTVVIKINDKAEISNSSARARQGANKLGAPSFFGIPQAIDKKLPAGATSAKAVDLTSSSSSKGNGSVRRKEKLTLRIAATVTEVLANGNLRIQGSQEVRVNFELRELLVTGFVRPEDISRKNEISYDKIASARISYGGRGQISAVQQPRYGKQFIDLILPF